MTQKAATAVDIFFNPDFFLFLLKILRHQDIALDMLLKLVRVFGYVIYSSLSAPSSVGIDIEAEQRFGSFFPWIWLLAIILTVSWNNLIGGSAIDFCCLKAGALQYLLCGTWESKMLPPRPFQVCICHENIAFTFGANGPISVSYLILQKRGFNCQVCTWAEYGTSRNFMSNNYS